MVDGKEVEITPKEYDEFFSDLCPCPKGRVYTPREQALIIEGYRRGIPKDELALKLHTSAKVMKRWYQAYMKEHGE